MQRKSQCVAPFRLHRHRARQLPCIQQEAVALQLAQQVSRACLRPVANCSCQQILEPRAGVPRLRPSINFFAQRNSIVADKMHSLPTFSLFAQTTPFLPQTPPILCLAFYVHKASCSSVDLGQLKHTVSNGRQKTFRLQLLSLSCQTGRN